MKCKIIINKFVFPFSLVLCLHNIKEKSTPLPSISPFYVPHKYPIPLSHSLKHTLIEGPADPGLISSVKDPEGMFKAGGGSCSLQILMGGSLLL